jgi:hypothetical protein
MTNTNSKTGKAALVFAFLTVALGARKVRQLLDASP